jgi:bifunctional DNA-binding transcriptional regulator/antitoxin component of YhaV-PrlF toxin-antitoxin module
MKITSRGQVTIRPAMRRKHGLRPQYPVEFVDQPDGNLAVKAGKLPRGRQALATRLRGGKIKGNTTDWIQFTRGDI